MYLIVSLLRSSVLVPMVMKTLMTVDIQLLFQIRCVSSWDAVSNLEMQVQPEINDKPREIFPLQFNTTSLRHFFKIKLTKAFVVGFWNIISFEDITMNL
jgi:hypothetical protein